MRTWHRTPAVSALALIRLSLLRVHKLRESSEYLADLGAALATGYSITRDAVQRFGGHASSEEQTPKRLSAVHPTFCPPE